MISSRRKWRLQKVGGVFADVVADVIAAVVVRVDFGEAELVLVARLVFGGCS